MPKVLYDKRGEIAYITLNRPDKRNAIDTETDDLLFDAWTRFREDDEVRLAILTGAGDKAFCAGADLSSHVDGWLEGGPGLGRSLLGRGFAGGITRGLHRTKKPVTAQRAKEIRLVNRVVPRDQLMPTAEDIAAKILRNPRAAVESAKDTILEVVGRPLDDQLRLECLYSYSTMGDPEIVTRKDEFLQRRDADRPTTSPAAGNGVR
jgi:enoyl-CoA hydratase/carnithine racemase